MCLAFIDYEKAFDSVEHLGIISAVRNHGVSEAYIDLLSNTYNNGCAETKLDRASRKFPIKRGVWQGDTVSPRLFNAALEEVFRTVQFCSVHPGRAPADEQNARFAFTAITLSPFRYSKCLSWHRRRYGLHASFANAL